MNVGRVTGTVVSTINDPFFDGKRLLLCDVLDVAGEPDGYTIAVDAVNAGVGRRSSSLTRVNRPGRSSGSRQAPFGRS